jgi:glutathione synthase/RimK-type ligase-like ATP-grasp enzyme
VAYNEVVLEISSAGLTGSLAVGGTPFPLTDVGGIYARPLTLPAEGGLAQRERGRVVHEALMDWMDTADCLIVSRPSAMHSNASKPFQAQEIAAAGLAVPETLITSDPRVAREFLGRHGRVVFKSTSGIRSIVRRLDEANAARLEQLRHLPTQFQQLIDGTDVRVHVVGDVVFATEITSAALDYRYARRDGLEASLAPCELPDEIAERCIALAARLDLPFAGIDLRRRADGSYVCFEVNPMPGYSYFEAETEQPISAALVKLLARHAPGT